MPGRWASLVIVFPLVAHLRHDPWRLHWSCTALLHCLMDVGTLRWGGRRIVVAGATRREFFSPTITKLSRKKVKDGSSWVLLSNGGDEFLSRVLWTTATYTISRLHFNLLFIDSLITLNWTETRFAYTYVNFELYNARNRPLSKWCSFCVRIARKLKEESRWGMKCLESWGPPILSIQRSPLLLTCTIGSFEN
jgi:hypothetical protein